MGGGPAILNRGISKSNTELTTALRSNFESSRDDVVENGNESGKASWKSWTAQQDDNLYIPAVNFAYGLSEERAAYDITVKLFFLPNIPVKRRPQHTKEAIDLVLKELQVKSIDLLIVSFPGIVFDADDESEDDLSDPPSPSAVSDPMSGPAEDVESMMHAWQTLEQMHDEGVIARLGLSEFGSQRLQRFLQAAKVRPSVDQINVRDCCVVPKPLIMFAKQEQIELLTHNDCTNILPGGTLRELLGSSESGVGVLADNKTAGAEHQGALHGDVEPQWVVKYTAVVKDRGVVENKGYFAGADLNQP